MVVKQKPSAFFGSDVLSTLISLRIDTVIVVGGDTSDSVRATVVDSTSFNFRTMVVSDCLFDRFRLSPRSALRHGSTVRRRRVQQRCAGAVRTDTSVSVNEAGISVALGQFHVTPSAEANLAVITRLADRAAEQRANLLVLPECASARYDPRVDLRQIAEPLNGQFVTALRDLGARYELAIVAGMLEARTRPDAICNSVIALAPDGSLLGVYRKLHLFDAPTARESDHIVPGEGDLLTFSVSGVTCGVVTCYDIRFPEISRRLALLGAELLLVPTAWVAGPGKEDQWDVLIRARAIENTVYVAGSAKSGASIAAEACWSTRPASASRRQLKRPRR